MFDNIGGKIKTLAKVICWIGIALSAIAALGCFAINIVGPGLIVLIFGPLASWLGSFFMYGFGELIETNSTIVELLRRSGTGNAGEPKIPTDFHWEKPRDPTPGRTTGTCEACGKQDVTIRVVEIKDDLGTRYRKLCGACAGKLNAVPERTGDPQ